MTGAFDPMIESCVPVGGYSPGPTTCNPAVTSTEFHRRATQPWLQTVEPRHVNAEGGWVWEELDSTDKVT